MADRAALTYANLLPLLASGNDEGTVEMLAGRNEKERRAVGPELSAAYREWYSFRDLVPFHHLDTAAAAVLGTASLTELKRLGEMHQWGQYCSEATYLVIRDRRPEWIDRWVEFALDEQVKRSGRARCAWAFFRLLIREGVCATPACDSYTLDMIRGITETPFGHRARWHEWREQFRDQPGVHHHPDEEEYYRSRQGRTIAVVVDDDPTLLEDEVWRLFQVRGRPSRMLHADWDEAWALLLVDRANNAAIDRNRLLDECLQAIGRNFPESQLRWCIRLHDLLEPTADERSEHLPDYIHLLGSGEKPVMKFAVTNLSVAEDEGVLDGEEFVASLDSILLTAPTVTANASLKLLDRVLTRDASLTSLGLETAISGLSASHLGVQKAALRVIERHWAAGTSHATESALAEQSELIDDSLRPRLAKLID